MALVHINFVIPFCTRKSFVIRTICDLWGSNENVFFRPFCYDHLLYALLAQRNKSSSIIFDIMRDTVMDFLEEMYPCTILHVPIQILSFGCRYITALISFTDTNLVTVIVVYFGMRCQTAVNCHFTWHNKHPGPPLWTPKVGEKVGKVSLIRGRVEKIGIFLLLENNRFCRIFVQSFSTLINCLCIRGCSRYSMQDRVVLRWGINNSVSFQRRNNSGFVTLPVIPSFHDVFRTLLAGD
jgi:hypothetical protein